MRARRYARFSDYSQLYIEGLAFEQDAGSIAAVARRKWTVRAVFEAPKQ